MADERICLEIVDYIKYGIISKLMNLTMPFRGIEYSKERAN